MLGAPSLAWKLGKDAIWAMTQSCFVLESRLSQGGDETSIS